MAVNLTGKADATIATAAARAGAALAGPDYSKSFQGIATGYSQAMGKMGAGLQSLAFVGTVATSNLVKNIQTAKEKYGSQDFNAVKGHFKGLIKEGFDVIFSKKEDRDVEKEEFKSKFQNSFGSLKGMINGTFFAEKLVEEGEYNRAYLEENPAEAAKFDILRSTKENPVKAEGLPYDGCYSELEMVDGNWKRMYYGPNGEQITSFDEDGTPKFKGTKQVGSSEEERVVKNPREKLKGEMIPGSETGEGEDEGALYDGSGLKSEEEYIKTNNILGKYTAKTYGDIESGDKEPIDKALKIMGYETNAEGFAKFQEDDMFSSSFNRPNLIGEAEVVAEAEHFGLDETGVGGLIVRKNPDVQVAIQEAQLAAMQDGADGLEFKPNEYKNVLKEVINNRDKFVDMTYTPIGNQEYSYAQLLAQPNEMTKEMFNQVVAVADGLSGIDRGADNVLNMQDFDGPEDAANLAILRKGMLNYNNPQAREIFYDFLTEEGASQHKLRFDKYKRDNTVITTDVDDEDGVIRTKRSVQPTAGFVDKNRYFPASSMNNLALDINKHADIEISEGTFATWNDAGYYEVDGQVINNKASMLTTYFGEELTNDFKLTDVYRSIEDWDAGGATSQTQDKVGTSFGNMIKANFNKGDRESNTQSYLLDTLKVMSEEFPQLKNMLSDFESKNLDYDAGTGYALRYDVDGDGTPENYYFKSEDQKAAAANQFIAALNKRIAGGTVNNEFAQ